MIGHQQTTDVFARVANDQPAIGIENARLAVAVQDLLDGKAEPPVMPGPNPWPLWTTEWFAWKELTDNYVPYHGGTTPSGAECRKMPRVREVRPGVYRCPACGKEFPTSMAQLEAEGKTAEYVLRGPTASCPRSRDKEGSHGDPESHHDQG